MMCRYNELKEEPEVDMLHLRVANYRLNLELTGLSDKQV